ncbi:MAG: hypothetical protein KatS3mg023_3788 [Armatimonadota bacterium]|nr:MAG: hypothetical protein KatS3mg023_3788 [Armatimonadota bacterium]
MFGDLLRRSGLGVSRVARLWGVGEWEVEGWVESGVGPVWAESWLRLWIEYRRLLLSRGGGGVVSRGVLWRRWV